MQLKLFCTLDTSQFIFSVKNIEYSVSYRIFCLFSMRFFLYLTLGQNQKPGNFRCIRIHEKSPKIGLSLVKNARR